MMLHSHFPLSTHVQNGQTAFHHAVELGHTKIVRVLLEKGQADVSVRDRVRL